MAELMVAGAILGATFNVLFDRLASRQVVDFFRRKKLGEGLLKEFQTLLTAVYVLLDDAEMKEFSNHPGVKKWLDDLKDVMYNAEDLLDEIYTMATNPNTKSGFTGFTGFIGRSKIKARRVENIIARLNNILALKDHLGLSAGVRDTFAGREPTTSLVEDAFIGRDAEKEKIVESLLLDSAAADGIPEVIPIVGMGGMGKTTLAKIIYNDQKVVDHFNLRAWACDGTDKYDVFRLTKNILESVTTSSDSNTTNLDVLQLKLKEELSGKKLLLILDDVWEDDYSKWRKLCAPFATISSGSKIIVTTRNASVPLMMMGADSFDSLEQLSDDSSWELFQNHAFGKIQNLDAYPRLKEIGERIVKKCKGLPLAIKTLAGALRGKTDVKDWEMLLKSEIWESSSVGTSNNILPVLKLSYHYLPSHLKQCFAYCSIFPQDYEFVKNALILLWMAEGFLVDKDNNNMEELGERYFDELVSRSFFQKSIGINNGACFVMHDLMNDLAQYVSGDFSHAFHGSESPQVSDKVRHFSYSVSQYDVHQIKPFVEATNLRTFFSVQPRNFYFNRVSAKLLSDLLPKLGCVRVLSLPGFTNVLEFPNSIGSLVHLRYLDLSGTNLESLPNTICKLYNLQTLLLRDCRHLTKLPTNLGDLVNLRHLDISGTYNLNKMPPGIRKLKSLQTLSKFIVGEDNCSGLGELKELRHLKGSLSIERLQNVKNVEDVIEANLKGKMGIEKLSFKWGNRTEVSNNQNNILDKLQPSDNLTHLTLDQYGGTRISNWLVDGSLFKLTYLKISYCEHCLSLPSLGQIPTLKELYISGLTSLRRMGVEFYKNGLSSIKPFQKLVILEFYDMSEWEDWSTSGRGYNDDFPKLEQLSLVNCPKLRENLPNLLPSLQKLNISGCTNIESNSFPCGMIESCNNFEELIISGWSALTHFPNDSLPTTLRKLEIKSCNNVEFLPKETFHNYKYLETLRLHNSCESMTSFQLGLFSSLKYLEIKDCKNLESFSIAVDHRENLKFLQNLEINDCDKLIDFPTGGLPAPNLKSLWIRNCKNLKSLPEGMNTQLTSLESLSIHNCEELESLFPVGGLPSKLQDLSILSCKKVMAKRREWDLQNHLRFLTSLLIGDCEEIESFPAGGLPSNLKSLDIRGCKNLKSLLEGMNTQLTSLESLSIHNCDELESLFPAGGLPSNLKSLDITGCKKVMAKRREWDLQNHLLFLTSLTIGDCEEIDLFPEADCQSPTSLTELILWNLRNLERIDANRLLNLSSLTTLVISYCPKVKFDPKPRNAQHLPTSFHKLEINDCPLLAKQLRTMKRDLIPYLEIDCKRV